MDWLNSLGAATGTGTGNVLRLLIHKLDLDQDGKFVKFRF